MAILGKDRPAADARQSAVAHRNARMFGPGEHGLRILPSATSGAGGADQFRYDQRRLSARKAHMIRSEEHTSELQSLMRISYAVFCLKKKKKTAEIRKAY